MNHLKKFLKLTFLLFLLTFISCFTPSYVEASDSGVSLSATVLAPPTINDFDLSGINPDAKPIIDSGSVKGSSTEAKNDSTAKIIAFELIAVVIVAWFFYFMKRKRRRKKPTDPSRVGEYCSENCSTI